MEVQRGPSEETTKQPARAAALPQPTVAVLVFFAASARTRIVAADLLAGADERRRDRHRGVAVAIGGARRGKRLVVVGVLIFDVAHGRPFR